MGRRAMSGLGISSIACVSKNENIFLGANESKN